MSEELNNGALRLAVAQICQSMGWDALNKSTHDLLTDVLQKYMLEIAKCAHEYSQLYCHTEPSLDDLGLAFKQTGVLLHELEDFVSQVDQVPFSYQLPQFPLPKPNLLQHPHKEDIVDRPEFYHEHMPPLIKALQQNEDEREGNKDQTLGTQDPASQTFLRNEIKTVGKETEAIENLSDKRPHVTSSPDLEADSKRRRLEGPFGKHSKETSLDILQVLQENNSSNTLSPISPNFVPSKALKPAFNFASSSLPTPPVLPSSTPAKKDLKTDKTSSKDKTLLSPPKQKSTITKQSSASSDKVSDKIRTNVLEGPSSTNKKSTLSRPASSNPVDKSLQLHFSKPKTPKKEKSKVSPVESLIRPKEDAVSPSSSLNPAVPNLGRDSQASKHQDQLMPKLIIKPMKLEKNQTPEYSVSSVPIDGNLTLNKSKLSIASTSLAGNLKPKKKKKKKVLDVLQNQPTAQALPVHTPVVASSETKSGSSGLFKSNKPEVPGEVTKKKKKKHKEKDREKSKPKKAKELSSSETSAHIPTIKLKLENTPTTTIPSQSVPTAKINVAPSEPATIKVKYETPEMTRTVITETLSTTVQVYYCPACGLPDDGSFMIGCDTCDSWYHGACVGILDDPGGDWFCEICLGKKAKKKKKKKKQRQDLE